MKKIFLLYIFCMIFSYSLFCDDLKIFDKVNKPYGFSLNSKYGEIAYFVYRSSNDYELIWEGSGFDLHLSNFYEKGNDLYIDFYKVWTGAEEIEKNDNRRLYYYKICLNEEELYNSKKENFKSIENVVPILILKDSPGSVAVYQTDCIRDQNDKLHMLYRVKSVTNILQKTDLKSKILKKISKENSFFILDVLCSKKSSADIWLKINCDGTEGYIPLSSLADNWTVVENHLGEGIFSNPEANIKSKNVSQRAVTKKNAVLNDTRVRLRVKPNLSCQTVTHLNKGDKVKITDRSDEIFEIDGESWYWYKVETTDLKNGWVYGKYLDIEK